jgi:hypothetical protein
MDIPMMSRRLQGLSKLAKRLTVKPQCNPVVILAASARRVDGASQKTNLSSLLYEGTCCFASYFLAM